MQGLPKSLGVRSPGSGPLPWAAAAALWASLVAAQKPKKGGLFFSSLLIFDALSDSAGVFPAPSVQTALPRGASTPRGHRAVVNSTSIDHMF